MPRDFTLNTDQILVSSDSSINNFSEFTCTFWIYARDYGHGPPFGGPTYGRVFERGTKKIITILGTSPDDPGLSIRIGRADTLYAASFAELFFLNQWNFISCAYSESQEKLRIKTFGPDLNIIDTVSVDNPGAGATEDDDGEDIYIGKNNGDTGFTMDGVLSELNYYNLFIEDVDVLKGLALGRKHPDYIPSLYLPLEGIQSPEPDHSGNSNNGVLTGTVRGSTAPPLSPRSHLLARTGPTLIEPPPTPGGSLSTSGISYDYEMSL